MGIPQRTLLYLQARGPNAQPDLRIEVKVSQASVALETRLYPYDSHKRAP